MTDITELAQRMRIAATMASQGAWSYARSGFNSIVRTSANLPSGGASRVVLCKLFRSEWRGELKTAQDAQFIALANPANVLALVEALEEAQGAATQQGNIASALFDEVNQLRRHADEKAPELRALLIEADSELEALHQRITELESSGVAPGILRCTECSFVLTKNIISVTADTITTVESEPEPCPNGCGQLQPVTWKALAIQLMFTTKQGLSDLLEAKKRIEELESDLSEWTDCKHDGATYYDMSGQERCGRCGADV
ncbi:ead/Ea22-like family protein [Klebsiella pneumoniae]